MGTRLCWVGFAGLLAMAGCGRLAQFGGEREAWRHEAEVSCIKSGALKSNPGVVQITPIEGPGICGADFPLKVSALGEASPAMSYSDDIRPPGSVPGAAMPPWPPAGGRPYYQGQPSDGGPPMQIAPASASRGVNNGIDDYVLQGSAGRRPAYAPANAPDYPIYPAPRNIAPPVTEPAEASEPDDIPDDAILPNRDRAPRQTYRPPPAAPAPRYEPPKLGPARPMPVTNVTASVTPPATLACPLVSALDRWVAEGVQPAAWRWFNQPVVEIKQISSYSCRGMVGSGTHHISEHAFGNALDVAGFVLADGRKIMVKSGWSGSPEESGFLHDVQGSACDLFTTVLAPGYNVYHYNHIHVDLMRRSSGRRPCRPTAIPGEVAAARQMQKSKYAHGGDRLTTGSIASRSRQRAALAGDDGDFDDE
jgi:hypothetical protein